MHIQYVVPPIKESLPTEETLSGKDTLTLAASTGNASARFPISPKDTSQLRTELFGRRGVHIRGEGLVYWNIYPRQTRHDPLDYLWSVKVVLIL